MIAIETEIGTVIEIEIAIVVIELQKGIYIILDNTKSHFQIPDMEI